MNYVAVLHSRLGQERYLTPNRKVNTRDNGWNNITKGAVSFRKQKLLYPQGAAKFERTCPDSSNRWKQFVSDSGILDLTADPAYQVTLAVVNRSVRWGPPLKKDTPPDVPLNHLGLFIRKKNIKSGGMHFDWTLLLDFTVHDMRMRTSDEDPDTVYVMFHNNSPLVARSIDNKKTVVLIRARDVVWKGDEKQLFPSKRLAMGLRMHKLKNGIYSVDNTQESRKPIAPGFVESVDISYDKSLRKCFLKSGADDCVLKERKRFM